MNSRTLRPFLLGLFFSLLALGPAAGESPRDELLRLVPEDSGFCVIVQDLRGHGEALAHSPLLEHVQKSPLGLVLNGAGELRQLFDLQKKVEDALKLDFVKLRDEVFGDAVVFAYRPGPPDNPKLEQDLLLIRAR